jgi:putative ABC transport system permease protein
LNQAKKRGRRSNVPEWKQEIRQRLQSSRLEPARESAIVEELGAHLDDYYAELLAGGATEAEAERQTLAELGESELLERELRGVERPIKYEPVVLGARRTNMLKDGLQDLRYGLRLLRRSPGFTAVAVLSLAIGIGANSVIFTALDAALWKPLPVADPDSLVRFATSRANRDDTSGVPSAFADGLAKSGVLTDVITQTSDGLSFSYGDRAERIVGEVVSPNFFPALGVAPILGQGFTPEVRAGRWAPEVVLSYRFWKRRFAGAPDVIGRTVHLNTYPFTIVGVSSPAFFDLTRGFEPELRLPGLPAGQRLSQIALLGSSPPVMARLKPGVTIAQAEAAADIQFQEFLRTTTAPEISRAGYQHLRLLPGARGGSGGLDQFRAPLFALFALVAIVLLIACANVANLLLARATARHRELAVRASVGASRSRLIRQMLAESALLSLLGGSLALAVASWTAPVLLGFLPQGHVGIVLDLHPDARVLLFTFALSFLTSVLFGLAPAIRATRGDLAATLKADSNASIGESRRTGLRQLLVVSQVGLSLTLLIVTGVCLRTVANLRPIEFQASSDRALLFTMKPQEEIYTPERKHLLVTELLRRVSELPGVGGVALAENGPLGSRSDDEWIEAPGHSPIRVDVDWVSPRFFDTIGVPLLAGRDFTAADKQGAPPVVIVNQSLARELFKDETPIGRSLSLSYGRSARRLCEIVGVVADTHYYDVHEAPRPTAWFTFQEYTPYMPTLHVRASTPDTAGVVAAVRHEFDAIDKGFPVFNIKTLELRIEDKLSQERLVADLAAAFGILALLLAAVGLYGVLAYAVSRRTREIGIRMALGATRADVLWMVLKESAWLVVIGIAIGAPMAIAATRLISATLFGLGAADPITILVAALLLIGVAAVASFLPARRAAQVDPMIALRCE